MSVLRAAKINLDIYEKKEEFFGDTKKRKRYVYIYILLWYAFYLPENVRLRKVFFCTPVTRYAIELKMKKKAKHKVFWSNTKSSDNDYLDRLFYRRVAWRRYLITTLSIFCTSFSSISNLSVHWKFLLLYFIFFYCELKCVKRFWCSFFFLFSKIRDSIVF